MLNLFHLNIRSARNKSNELEALIHDMDVDVLCLTEHWLKNDESSVFNINGYRLGSCFARKQNKGGGSAIFCKPSVNLLDNKSCVALVLR